MTTRSSFRSGGLPRSRLKSSGSMRPAPLSAAPVHLFTAPAVVNISGPGSQQPHNYDADGKLRDESVAVWKKCAERFLAPAESAREALTVQFEILKSLHALLPIPPTLSSAHTELLLAGLMQICYQRSVLAPLALALLADCLDSAQAVDVLCRAAQRGVIDGAWVPLSDFIAGSQDPKELSVVARVASSMSHACVVDFNQVGPLLQPYEILGQPLPSTSFRLMAHGIVRGDSLPALILEIPNLDASAIRVCFFPNKIDKTEPEQDRFRIDGDRLRIKLNGTCLYVITCESTFLSRIKSLTLGPLLPPRSFKVTKRKEARKSRGDLDLDHSNNTSMSSIEPSPSVSKPPPHEFPPYPSALEKKVLNSVYTLVPRYPTPTDELMTSNGSFAPQYSQASLTDERGEQSGNQQATVPVDQATFEETTRYEDDFDDEDDSSVEDGDLDTSEQLLQSARSRGVSSVAHPVEISIPSGPALPDESDHLEVDNSLEFSHEEAGVENDQRNEEELEEEPNEEDESWLEPVSIQPRLTDEEVAEAKRIAIQSTARSQARAILNDLISSGV